MTMDTRDLSLNALTTRIVADSPDGILYSNCQRVIRLWNEGCVRILGFTAAEAIDRSFEMIVPDNLRVSTAAILGQ